MHWLRPLALALAACGDNATPPDAAVVVPACSASFSGNFVETSHGADDCATLALDAQQTWNLAFSIPVASLAASLDVSVALGTPPTVGTLTSETATSWSALANAHCTYRAGSTYIPHGSFELTLDSVDVSARTAHGTLALIQYVLTFPGNVCGYSDTELVDLTF